MFDNVGKKIKVVAMVCFYVITIASIMMAFASGLEELGYNSGEYEKTFIPELFWPLFLGGPLFALISSWLIYGFGILVEKAENEQNTEIKKPYTPPLIANSKTASGSFDETSRIGKCQLCDKSVVAITYARIKDNMGTRYRYVCEDCFKKNKCEAVK